LRRHRQEQQARSQYAEIGGQFQWPREARVHDKRRGPEINEKGRAESARPVFRSELSVFRVLIRPFVTPVPISPLIFRFLFEKSRNASPLPSKTLLYPTEHDHLTFIR